MDCRIIESLLKHGADVNYVCGAVFKINAYDYSLNEGFDEIAKVISEMTTCHSFYKNELAANKGKSIDVSGLSPGSVIDILANNILSRDGKSIIDGMGQRAFYENNQNVHYAFDVFLGLNFTTSEYKESSLLDTSLYDKYHRTYFDPNIKTSLYEVML